MELAELIHYFALCLLDLQLTLVSDIQHKSLAIVPSLAPTSFSNDLLAVGAGSFLKLGIWFCSSCTHTKQGDIALGCLSISMSTTTTRYC